MLIGLVGCYQRAEESDCKSLTINYAGCKHTKHLLNFDHSGNLSRFSATTSIAGNDPELVLCPLGHVGEGVLAQLCGCGVAQCPVHLVYLLHLNQVTSDNRTTLLLWWQPGKCDGSPGAV